MYDDDGLDSNDILQTLTKVIESPLVQGFLVPMIRDAQEREERRTVAYERIADALETMTNIQITSKKGKSK